MNKNIDIRTAEDIEKVELWVREIREKILASEKAIIDDFRSKVGQIVDTIYGKVIINKSINDILGFRFYAYKVEENMKPIILYTGDFLCNQGTL